MHGAAIEPREVERTREGQEEFVVWEKRRRRIGLCRFSEYYVGRPTSRTTTESYKETVFELKPDQIMVRHTAMHFGLYPLSDCEQWLINDL